LRSQAAILITARCTMSSAATAALAAARRAAQQARGPHAHLMFGAQRTYSSVPGALGPGSRLSALFQQDLSPAQQLISLRRHLSSRSSAVPGGVPGTGGGAAETQTGAGGPAAGSAESSTGAATGPAGGGAETSTGLGTPGQTAPAEAGTGLREPTDAPPVEQHEGASTADDVAAAERTAGPQQPPTGAGDTAEQTQMQPQEQAPGSANGEHAEPAVGAATGGPAGGEQPGSPQPEGRSQGETYDVARLTCSVSAFLPQGGLGEITCLHERFLDHHLAAWQGQMSLSERSRVMRRACCPLSSRLCRTWR